MPRFNLTNEEFALIEKLRVKNAETLGYNKGLEQAAILIETGALTREDQGSNESILESMARILRTYKKELVL